MLTSGDVIDLDLGAPIGREAGALHPAVIVTAQRILDRSPSVIHVVPLTSTQRAFESEIRIAPHGSNGLEVASSAQCQHVRSVSTERVLAPRGNIGSDLLAQVRETIAMILDVPGH